MCINTVWVDVHGCGERVVVSLCESGGGGGGKRYLQGCCQRI